MQLHNPSLLSLGRSGGLPRALDDPEYRASSLIVVRRVPETLRMDLATRLNDRSTISKREHGCGVNRVSNQPQQEGKILDMTIGILESQGCLRFADNRREEIRSGNDDDVPSRRRDSDQLARRQQTSAADDPRCDVLTDRSPLGAFSQMILDQHVDRYAVSREAVPNLHWCRTLEFDAFVLQPLGDADRAPGEHLCPYQHVRVGCDASRRLFSLRCQQVHHESADQHPTARKCLLEGT